MANGPDEVETAVSGASAPASRLALLAPGLADLRSYRREWLRGDLVAGATLAAYLLPASIGDASLANLPPEAGIYACMFSGLVFWLFCSSRHTVVTVTSAISLVVGASLGGLAGGDPGRFSALAAATALLVSALAFAAWLASAGGIVSFVSETVMTGFKFGAGLYLASTQLPKLFGFAASHGNFWERSAHFFSHLGETNPAALAVGGGALALLVAGKRWLPNRPVGLLVVVGGVAAAAALDLASYSVKLLGHVPQGLPPLGVPGIEAADLNALLPLALACFMLGTVETAAIGRMFAAKHGYRLDANRELLALAAGNLAAGLGQAFPVSGGMSQSLVNEGAGARTPLSGLVAAVLVLLVSLFLSGSLRDLPQPVLAAIVLVALGGLIKVEAFAHLWRFSRGEFLIAALAALGVLGSGLLRGVLIGAALSIVMLLRRAARPNTAELGRVPGTEHWADVSRHPENEIDPRVLVVRVESALLYFNVDYVRERFRELWNARAPGVRLAILHLGSSPTIDLAGAELIAELHRNLRRAGVELRLSEARGQVRDALQRAGFEAEYGPIEPNQTVARVLEAERQGASGRPQTTSADSSARTTPSGQ
ncbi:MAG: SulP family inorganic anion transporter [Myxococcota bacterium]